MSKFFDIRPFKEGDEKEILELFTLAYGGRQMGLSYWRWRFQDNPAGRGVIELGWYRDVLAAHYAVSSLPMCIDSQNRLAGLSGTTMTHPVYQGRGLFPILARSVYQEAVSRGMVMVWGFPNAMSHRGFICYLGWKDIYQIPTLRMQLAHYKRVSVSGMNDVIELSYADERLDRFWKRINKDYDIIVRRDRSYIHWRYFSNPIEKYYVIAYVENNEIRGWAVFKRYRAELQVVDLLIGRTDIGIGECLIHVIILKATDFNAKSISLWLNPTHPFYHALEKMDFRPEEPISYLGGLSLSPDFDESLYDFRRWYYTMSDSDVF